MLKLLHILGRRGSALTGRAKNIRGDESGQIVLLSGVMVFLVVILTIITFDTTKAICNRITAQNSVDAAADAAALWQARGCNLLQHLNNIHYDVNAGAIIAETAALCSCIVAPYLRYVPYVGKALWFGACCICWMAPGIDTAQEGFASVVEDMQSGITEVFPGVVLAQASAAAKGSGASELGEAAPQYAKDMLNKLGVPGADAIGSLADALKGIPLFAFPLDTGSVDLNVEKKQAGENDMPWSFPESIVGELRSLAEEGADSCWGVPVDQCDGWQDNFFKGHPGFMTWIAGTAGQDELLGIGDHNWLSGGRADEAAMEENSRVFYSPDSVKSGASTLTIPAFMAIASSQIEGNPVISYSDGESTAKGKIIKVYFPPDSDPTAGEDFLIYH